MSEHDTGAGNGVTGGCYCGRIRYEARFPSRFVGHCHCNNCRRAHGAAFVTWAGFPDGQLRFLAGGDELAHWTTDTGATRSFCPTCGSTLFFRSERWPNETHLAVGNLDGPLDREPSGHVYADRSPSWCPTLGDSLPRCGGESGMDPL